MRRLLIAVALLFDFTNGFHDSANAIATSVSTRSISPRLAVLLSGALNFVGAFYSLKVANTIAKGIVDAHNVVKEGRGGSLPYALLKGI